LQGLEGQTEFFISPQTITTPRPTLDQTVENSTYRKIHLGSIDEFWSLFEKRAEELSIKPGNGLTDVMSQNHPYDTNLDTNLNRRENPVQNYLRDALGLDRVESRDLYKSIQVAYLGGGKTAAQMAYTDFLSDKLEFSIRMLAETLRRYREIKSVEFNDKLLGPHKQVVDEVSPFVDSILSSLETNQALQNMIVEAGISIKDRARVRQYLIDNIDKLLSERSSTQNDSFTNIIRMSSPITRYRDGIKYEKDNNLGSYNGPLSTLSKYNNHMYDIIRFRILLGHSYKKSLSYLNFVLTNERRIPLSSKDGGLEWINEEFEAQSLTCKSIL
jgi:hypothetical protein